MTAHTDAQSARGATTDDFPETRSSWGSHAQQVCRRVLGAWRELPDDERTEARLRLMLRDAYPFGERANHPYQIWLRQQQVTLWLAGFAEMPAHVKATQPQLYVPPKEQMTMFVDADDTRPDRA